MRMNIIFDLDLTLVDTTVAEPYRSKRDWNGAFSVIPQCTVYDGLNEIFEVIKKFDINTCIVSTSPRPYVEKVVQQFNLPINHIVAYHDAKPIKPHPASMLKALEMLGCDAKSAISFGDRVIDIQSSNAAGIESVACFWGTKEKAELVKSDYTHAIIKPGEILTLIR
ncbi:MAG: HAD family hydrolase [Paludibacteraceae bacterium]|nr:HAD family hydrolase [Paludibacteraceae bacterium]